MELFVMPYFEAFIALTNSEDCYIVVHCSRIEISFFCDGHVTNFTIPHGVTRNWGRV